MIGRAALVATGLLGGPIGALGAEAGGCGRFAWDVAPDLRLMASPASVPPSSPGGAFQLALRDGATLPHPPERQPRSGPGAAGHVAIAIAEPGTYRITLSTNAWIDALQDGLYMKPDAFSGVQDCPGARKSVRFRFKPGPLILQLSGPAAEVVIVAISPER